LRPSPARVPARVDADHGAAGLKQQVASAQLRRAPSFVGHEGVLTARVAALACSVMRWVSPYSTKADSCSSVRGKRSTTEPSTSNASSASIRSYLRMTWPSPFAWPGSPLAPRSRQTNEAAASAPPARPRLP
jgi:hypothetical protein